MRFPPLKVDDTRKGPFGWLDETEEVYHANGAIGSTQAKWMHTDPLLYYLRKTGLDVKPPTPAMLAGRRAHCYFLENQRFRESYAFKPAGMNLSTKEGIAWKHEHAHQEIIAQEEHSRLALSLKTCPPDIYALFANNLLEREKSLRVNWRDLGMQARFDLIEPSAPRRAWDLKRTTAFDDFERQAYNLGTWLQIGWYETVYAAHAESRLDEFWLIVSESVAPYRWRLWRATDELRDAALTAVEKIIDTLLACYDSNEWRVPQEPAELALPAWAREMQGGELVMESDCVE